MQWVKTPWHILAPLSCTDFGWMQLYSYGQLTALAIAGHEHEFTIHQRVKRKAEVTHHMACTDTGLKTCDRPAVVTLKPLVMGRGEEEKEEEKIRWRPGRKHRPRWASCSGAIHPWNIPLAHMDNVDRSANKGPPGTKELKKEKDAVPCCFQFLPLGGSKRQGKNNNNNNKKKTQQTRRQTQRAPLLCRRDWGVWTAGSLFKHSSSVLSLKALRAPWSVLGGTGTHPSPSKCMLVSLHSGSTIPMEHSLLQVTQEIES